MSSILWCFFNMSILKKSYANHIKSFSTEKNKNNAKLSTKYWKLANKKLHPRISWSKKDRYKSYNPNSRGCSLCLHKKNGNRR